MTTVVHLPGADVEINYPRGRLPKHDGRELTIDDLRIFYTCIHHVKDDNGQPLSDKVLRGIVGVKLQRPDTGIPIVVEKFRNPDYPWTKVIAELVETEDWRQELLLRIPLLYEELPAGLKLAKHA